MKKIVRDEIDKLTHEFGGLVQDGFTLQDELMVTLLDKIETKRLARKAELEAKKAKAIAPPYIKDVQWDGGPTMVDGKVVHPRIGGRGITKRPFTMFAGPDGEAAYQMVMASIRWKKSPVEPWRVIAIHIMAWELAESRQTFPMPSWVDLQAYAPKRFRTTDEVMEDHLTGKDEELNTDVPDRRRTRKKRPTKKDILDAKYAKLLADL